MEIEFEDDDIIDFLKKEENFEKIIDELNSYYIKPIKNDSENLIDNYPKIPIIEKENLLDNTNYHINISKNNTDTINKNVSSFNTINSEKKNFSNSNFSNVKPNNLSLIISNTLKKEKINQYVITKKLGNGAFGKVKLFQNLKNNKYFAAKIYNLNNIKNKFFTKIDKDRIISMFEKEIIIMKKLNHKNIIRLEEDIKKNEKLYLIIEFAEKGIIKPINNIQNIQDYILIKNYINQFFEALFLLHNVHNIVHLDIKPSNILINKLNILKISDFGLSKIIGERKKLNKKIVGTLQFQPPECFLKKVTNEKLIDIWSMGITFYYLCLKKFPYGNYNEKYDIDIFKKKLTFPESFPKDLKKFLSKC